MTHWSQWNSFTKIFVNISLERENLDHDSTIFSSSNWNPFFIDWNVACMPLFFFLTHSVLSLETGSARPSEPRRDSFPLAGDSRRLGRFRSSTVGAWEDRDTVKTKIHFLRTAEKKQSGQKRRKKRTPKPTWKDGKKGFKNQWKELDPSA